MALGFYNFQSCCDASDFRVFEIELTNFSLGDCVIYNGICYARTSVPSAGPGSDTFITPDYPNCTVCKASVPCPTSTPTPTPTKTPTPTPTPTITPTPSITPSITPSVTPSNQFGNGGAFNYYLSVTGACDSGTGTVQISGLGGVPTYTFEWFTRKSRSSHSSWYNTYNF